TSPLFPYTTLFRSDSFAFERLANGGREFLESTAYGPLLLKLRRMLFEVSADVVVANGDAWPEATVNEPQDHELPLQFVGQLLHAQSPSLQVRLHLGFGTVKPILHQPIQHVLRVCVQLSRVTALGHVGAN